MKICWDNLEKIRLNKNGDFTTTYYAKMIYKDKCGCCGEPYLMSERSPTDFCSRTCSVSGSNNPMYGRLGTECPSYGSKRSKESIKKMSDSAKKRKHSEATKLKISKNSKGRKHSEATKLKMRSVKIGKKRSQEDINKMKASSRKGKDSCFWKGGIRKNKISLYDTYAHQVEFAEEVDYMVNQDGLKILLVKCVYCDKWFNPSTIEIQHRVSSLNGKSSGEKRLYCSKECKENCPTYNQNLYPKNFKKASSREVDPYTRKLCFERDDWTCQKCESNENLHCHHIKGYAQNKMLANDIDNCITLCKECHLEVHTHDGCRFVDLRCDYKKADNNFEIKARKK